jgi:hypothetical protein
MHDILAVTDFGCDAGREWLENITEPLRTNPHIDAVAGGYEITGRTFFEHCAAAAELRPEYVDKANFLPSSRSFAVRRPAFIEAGMYPERLSFAGEDTALCLALKSLKKEFAFRLDARVSWFPRSTFTKYVRQHILYGIGDGESGSRRGFYAKVAIKWFALLAALAGAFLWPVFWFFLVAAVGMYYMNLRLKYGWVDYGFGISIAAFFLVTVKELSFFAGFLRGASHSKRNRA